VGVAVNETLAAFAVITGIIENNAKMKNLKN